MWKLEFLKVQNIGIHEKNKKKQSTNETTKPPNQTQNQTKIKQNKTPNLNHTKLDSWLGR